MSICAEKFTDDEKVRNKFMGFMIGSDAAGVLCAYTVGILAFNVCGKLILFLLIAIIILVNASKYENRNFRRSSFPIENIDKSFFKGGFKNGG